jgi:hypothetical protein
LQNSRVYKPDSANVFCLYQFMEAKMSERQRQRRADREQGGSFTIGEWCEHRRISRAMFYKLAEQGLGPVTHNVGAKRLISGEADIAWVRAREADREANNTEPLTAA